MTRLLTTLTICGLLLGAVSTAAAQETVPTRSSGTRIALQGRLDAFNMFGVTDAFVGGDDISSLTIQSVFSPTATVGVRMDRLFLGLGVGLVGGSVAVCADDDCDDEVTVSNSGFSLSPMAAFDVLNDGSGALSLGGWLNLGNVGDREREEPDGGTEIVGDGFFMWGLSLAAGVRGLVTEGLALGSELGWGFLTWSTGNDRGDSSTFAHGLFGTLFVEGSVGL